MATTWSTICNCQHMPLTAAADIPVPFNYMGRPWRTQYWSRHFITETAVVVNESRGLFKQPLVRPVYRKTPDGFMPTMDDDGGSMSSHFVFSALGLYPACMGDPYYVIGSPLFPEVKLHLEGGRTFTVKADGAGLTNKYIQSATLNGKPWDKPWIDYAAIRAAERWS